MFKVIVADGLPKGEFGYTTYATREAAEQAIAKDIQKDVREGAMMGVYFDVAKQYSFFEVVEV